MPKYRKRAIEVEARKFDGNNADEIDDWCEGYATITEYNTHFPTNMNPEWEQCVFIETNEGIMEAQVGDYIIKEPFPSSNRRFYPCKPDIFAQTYELVEEWS